MKKHLIVPVFLTIGFMCGWANEVGMEQTTICGEISWNITECEACVHMRGCDGEHYLISVLEAPRCRFVKITNPVWGEVHIFCTIEGEGELASRRREVRAWCITDYNSAECIDSCKECSDLCADVQCSPQCSGCTLWATECVDGNCVSDHIIEPDSVECGCGKACGTVCIGVDLWSQTRVNGECVTDELVEAESAACGFNPCDNHCSNGKQDCGEYGVDCGGGCPHKDSDYDGIEDCKDLCPNSRCTRVDINGCETDADSDGVLDCDDECPTEKGDASNRGCPSNMMVLVASVGGVAAAAGGLGFAIKKTGVKAAEEAGKRVSKRVAEEIGMRATDTATKEAGTKIAEAATKEAGTKIAEAATKEAGTKIAEAATKEAGTKIAEAATKEAGTKIAEASAGAGITGAVARTQKGIIHCSHCGEKLPSGSKFCSKCGRKL